MDRYERTARSLRIRAAEKNPLSEELVLQWSPKNEYGPEEYSAKSQKKVWWICPVCKEDYMAVVASRTNGHICYSCGVNSRKPAPMSNEAIRKSSVTKAKKNPLPDHLALELVDKSNCNVPAGSHAKLHWKCENNHIWLASPNNRSKGSGCPECSLGNKSKAEEDIFNFLKDHGIDSVKNDRSMISPFEIDIFIQSKNIGIEFNGLYWHTESKKGKNYHHNKYVLAKNEGIQLIQIWEDDWNNKPDLIKAMLLAKICGSKPIGARKTKVKELSYADTIDFFNKYHIQGAVPGTRYIGLEFNDEIVAISVWKKNKSEFRLERYAAKTPVMGGLSKMMSLINANKFVTFADHCVSDGSLYENTGWVKDKELPPDYSYLYNGGRVHKFNFRIKRFKEDPGLEYVDGMTEKELASLNGLERIYDAGKTRYVYLR